MKEGCLLEQKQGKEKVILVGCQTTEGDLPFQYSMDELTSLTETANGEVLTTLIQKRERVSTASYIGRGKVEELRALV